MKSSMYSLFPALLSLFLFFSSEQPESQIPQPDKITTTTAIKTYQLFEVDTEIAAKSTVVEKATYLSLRKKPLQELYQDKPNHIQLRLPTGEEELVIELTKNEVLSDNFIARAETSEGLINIDYQPGAYYTGRIVGNPNSVITFSIFEDWVMAILTMDGQNYNLGPIDAASKGTEASYILYAEKDHSNPPAYECHTVDNGVDVHFEKTTEEVGAKMTSVVKVYIEADYKMYLDRGRNEQAVMDYVTGLFNELSVLYGNEQILTRISEIKVWTVQDPYPSSSSSAALNAFTGAVAGNFNGDLAHLFSTVPANNGGVAWLDVLCSPSRACAYSNIRNNYNSVPDYSWSVNVITHEMGHNLGSKHTHACAWGPNQNAALDDCYPTEGSCSRGPTPTNGGTIMSYCHLSSVGVNFMEGFGQEPGDLIRTKVALAPCLEDVFDCFTKIPLEAGITYAGNTANGGANNFTDYNCMAGAHRGNEIAHSFVSTQPGWAYINYSENMPERLDLFLMSTCDPDSCIQGWQGAPLVRDSFFVEFGVEYVFIVDVLEDSPGGAYELTISFPGSGCATTVSLTDGVTYTGNTDLGVSNFIDYSCLGGEHLGKEVGHFFISPVGGIADITFNNSSASTMNLFVANACNPDSCIQGWNGPNVTTTFDIEPGKPYYFIVDAIENGAVGDYSLTVSIPEANTCVCTDPTKVSICENFESYTTGDISPQSLCWMPDNSIDGQIATNRSASGSNSLLIDASGQTGTYSNVVMNLGNRILGEYILKFKINPGNKKDGYWRVYHTYDPTNPANNEVAFDVEMKYDPMFGGFAKLYAGNPNGSSITFAFIADGVFWSDFVVVIDLDNDEASLLYNGGPIYTWTFSNTRNGSGGAKRIGAINFYANNANTEYNIDDVNLYSNDGLFCDNSGGIFCEDFDPYSVGSLTQQTTKWQTMTGQGGAEDAVVVFTQASSGLNSLQVQSGISGTIFDNVVAKLGDHTSGKFVLQHQMYIKLGSKAAYRVLHEHVQNGADSTIFEVAHAAYFQKDGTGLVRAGGAGYPFEFPTDTWFYVVQLIDFDLDQTTLFINGRTVGTWNFSDTELGSGGTLKLAGLNILAPDEPFPNDPNNNIFDVFYYVDNVELFDLELFLSTDPKILNVDAAAGSTAFDVSSNTSWEIDEAINWLTTAPNTGSNNGTVNINFQENTSVETRRGQIKVRGQGTPVKQVDIIQLGALPVLSVTPGDQNIDPQAGTLPFSVTSNVLWTALSLDTTWLKVQGNAGANGDGTFTITFDQNLGGIRQDTILVTGPPAADVNIVITQGAGGPSLNTSADTVFLPFTPGTANFEVISNVTWNISDDAFWFDVTPASGSDIGTATINYDENFGLTRRTGTISISGSGGVSDKTVVVIQEQNVPFLSVDPLLIDLPAAPGGSLTLDLAANVDWTLTENANWFTVLQTSGDSSTVLNLNYDENMTPQARVDTITVTGNNGVAPVKIVVSQGAANAYMNAAPLTINLTADQIDTILEINTNVDWTLTENETWLSLSQTSGTGSADVIISVANNFNLSDRVGNITLRGSYGVSDIVIIINQVGTPPTLIVDPLAVTVGKDPGTTTIDITANVEWTISDDVGWLTADRSIGSGSTTVTLTFIENNASQSRVANITIEGTHGTGTRTVVLTQAGLGVTLEASPTDITVPATAGNVTFDVTSNIAWNLTESEPWFSLLPPSGFGNGTVRINYQTNPSALPRTGTITLRGSGAVDIIILVTQEGAAPAFDASPIVLNVPANDGSTGIDITGNVGWSATPNDAWLSVSPDTGVGTASISILYEANPLTTPRTGTITLSGSSGVSDITITVTQEGGQASIDADPTLINVSAPSGSTTFEVQANVEWTTNVSDSWLSVIPDQGTGNATVTINYDENMGAQNRTATIQIMAVGMPLGKTVTVVQGSAGAILTLDPATINVDAPAGSVDATLNANVTWAVSDDANWLDVSPTTGNATTTLTITYQENPDPQPRTATITASGVGVSDQTLVVTQAGSGAILTVSTTTLDVAAPQGFVTFDINSNVNWTVDVSDNWLMVSPASGNSDGTVTVNYDENPSTQNRMATITISGDNGVSDQIITITQEGAAAVLTVSQTTFNVSAPSGSVNAMVIANIDWTATSSEPWLTVVPPSGSGDTNIALNFDANTDSQNRTATVTVSGNGVPDQVITVTQAGTSFFLLLDQNTLNVGAPASDTDVNITANIAWTATANDNWIDVTPGSGSGDATLTISVMENTSTQPRSGTVTVTGNNVSSQTITINQSGTAAILTVNPTTLNVGSDAGNASVSINANINWNASVDQSWVSLSQTTGNGAATLDISFDENTDTQARTATITIDGNGLVPEQTVILTQAGAMAFLTVNPQAINVTSSAGNTTVQIASNVSWTMATSDTWFSVTPSSGSGPATLTVNYDENTDTDLRAGTITITPQGLPVTTINITQEGTIAPFLIITPGNQTVGSTPGNVLFNINANVNWTATSDQPWATVIPNTGSGPGVIVVTYAANTTNNPRTASITVSGAGLSEQVVTITQTEFTPTLTVNPQAYDVGAESGNVTFDLQSNISWSVNVDVPWVTVSPNFGSNNATLTATYEANPNAVARTATITISGGGLPATEVIINQSESTSITDLERKYQLEIFPNPVRALLNINMHLPQTESVRIEVSALTGRTHAIVNDDVLKAGTRTFEYNVEGLSQGIYFLRLVTKEGIAVRRFVVE